MDRTRQPGLDNFPSFRSFFPFPGRARRVYMGGNGRLLRGWTRYKQLPPVARRSADGRSMDEE